MSGGDASKDRQHNQGGRKGDVNPQTRVERSLEKVGNLNGHESGDVFGASISPSLTATEAKHNTKVIVNERQNRSDRNDC